ncbi:helix-turn-helix domain-containing protein [Erwinia pyrifoliae]|uniref:XRE family transcriptional regulator n=1 Tax=Erwinia pyrifoliae TaxID=79967 RepID=A0ABY5X4G9_ERWPY|nr:XRE family transcriptional regulator [Erwinia pyrifoliae]AUX72192.1 XRE family transcriptional regulator [Erwinia pyrifoliae]MCA8877568.1 helix-turn-helix transcriptional regulator [Erwinia pyrifoliae]MCT2388443.1 XRE family transcriptional regulator [Erwinia pyrifoliae]MCU8586612.1 XRE family transcriptional regulator [Erwinia pyrifoliae]UWS32279.1 XRE family transcriptional regulator [Erwinia pyrifoliae]
MDINATEQRLARRLAELRLEKSWSLETLAELTGISRASLSRIERAETSPTATLLNRLCNAYGLTMSRLLSEVEQGGMQLMRGDSQSVWHDAQSGYRRRSVSPPAQAFHAELVEARLDGGARIDYDMPSLAGLEQHIWMLGGVLEFTMDERHWRLEQGDCLRFHLFGRSSFHAPEATGAHYALVVARP